MQNYTPKVKNFENMVQEKIAGNHFTNHLGFKIHTIKPGRVEGSMALEQCHLQQMGFVHGGVTASVSDMVSGFAAFSLVSEGQGVVTVELKVSYLNPGKGHTLKAIGTVIKAGSKLHFCESELWVLNDDSIEILIAKASCTMAILNKSDFDIKQV